MSLVSTNDKLQDADDIKDGYIIGTVVNNADPRGLGRVQVSIPGLMAKGDANLPWVGPNRDSPFGQGVGYGQYGSPPVGAKIRIKFQNSDLNFGLIEAVHYGLAEVNEKFKDPNSWGWVDPAGNSFYVNGSTVETITAGGVNTTINGGDVTITAPGNITADAGGAINATAGSEVRVSAPMIYLN